MDDFSKSVAANANKTGQDAINSYDPTVTASNQLQGYNALNASQQGQANDFQGQYAAQIAKNPTAQDLLTTGNNMYGVPGLTQQATYLNNQVNSAYPNAVNQARGYDYSSGQVDNAVNQNLRFLQPESNSATANLNAASALAQGYQQAGLSQNATNLLPIQNSASLLSQAQNNQASNMTTTDTNEFQALNNKLTQGINLSASEMSQYQYLLSLQAAQTSANAQVQAAKVGQTYQTLNPSQTVYNTQTGAAYSPVGVNNLAASMVR